MDERIRSDRLAAWALATFHSTLLVAILAFSTYRSGGLGDLLADLGTGTGFALFLALWMLAWGTHAGWLNRLRPSRRWRGHSGLGVGWLHFPAPGSVLERIETGTFLGGATVWGAATGVGFLVALNVVLVGVGYAPVGFLLLFPFAVLFSAAIGAAVGFLCGLLDFFLLALASLLAGGAGDRKSFLYDRPDPP